MLQVDLDPEIETRLQSEAKARGLDAGSYAGQLLRRAILEDKAVASPDLHKFFEAMAADPVPKLPDEAFSRESFYRNGD